ncbi:restriction endonuclease subunit S [Aeromonas sp. PrichA-15]|uniref:restriction endonuclease subunit S n=1 Tax=Aeromonas sp. PrichA-15 TaxID=2823360 RepID=UPI001B33F3CB|nr:restriction endonuclease subunit S [Aeromonas sp. PrichA-15]MBP4034464.1 restriction endonuclease subunit S [Aeromonas sp. PrichA-15]
MSSEWQSYHLADAGRIVTGKTPKGNMPEYEGSEVPFVTPPDFTGSMWIRNTNRKISELGAQSVKGSIIPERSVLVTCIGSDMGKAALAASRCVTNQQINAVLVDETKFCPEFLYYNLSLRKDEIRGLAGGSAQPILNKSAFGQLCFSAPPLPAQRSVAASLRPINDRIALLRETNATLEAIAQALFKSWFVDFDPVHARARGEEPAGLSPEVAALFPDSFEESELGQVPKGWDCGNLGDVLKIAYGKNLPTAKLLESGFPVFGGNGRIGFYSQYLYEQRQVLVACRGAASGKINQSAPKSYVTNNSLVLESNDRIPFGYLKGFMSLSDLSAYVTGSAQPQVTIDNLKGFKIMIPSQSVTKAFESLSSELEERIQQNNDQAQTLATLRDTLLPRLISGQLRLSDTHSCEIRN